jgi:DNA uptake protein ComE-like DNA-binding protein
MTTVTERLASTCVAALLVLGLAACGGSTTTPTVSAPTATGAQASNSNATGSKVSANTASEEEIAAALASGGVSNSEKWAKEVVEYRPYPTDDANLTALRDKLAKYNPGQETTDKIVSALTP